MGQENLEIKSRKEGCDEKGRPAKKCRYVRE